MKRIVTLKTSEGSGLQIVLENWGSGLDDRRRRWTFEDPYWRCIDSGETAEQAGPVTRQIFSGKSPVLLR
jgi:hypothetical protein